MQSGRRDDVEGFVVPVELLQRKEERVCDVRDLERGDRKILVF